MQTGRTGRARSLTKTASMSYKAQPCTFVLVLFCCIFNPVMICSYKSPAPSVVDRVLLTANETDQFLVKVMVRQCRRPEVGDKYIPEHIPGMCLETIKTCRFASRHGQKGVCGAIVSQGLITINGTPKRNASSHVLCRRICHFPIPVYVLM